MMVDEKTDFGGDQREIEMPARSVPMWLVWVVAVPLIIIVFGVLNYFVAQREVRETMIRTRHILIGCNHGDVAASSVALERILKLKSQLDAGADFAQLAKEYSEDVNSAAKGGDLGYLKPDMFAGDFGTIALSLKKGEVSDVATTQYGYHLIQLIDRVDPVEAGD